MGLKFMVRYVSLIFIFTAFFLLGAEDEMIVELETEDSFAPLKISFIDEASGFTKQYIDELKNVLFFDFANNGMTYVIEGENQPFSFEIEAKVKDQQFHILARSIEEHEEYKIDPQPLSGYLEEDRVKIHLLSDALHKAFFGFDGIAAKKILYTVRNGNEKWGFSDVWECAYDGGNPKKITNNQGYCLSPVYVQSLKGGNPASFLYVSYKSGQPKIYMAELRDGIGKRVINLSGNQFMPQVSRQRDFIAFVNDITRNPDIFIQELGENGPTEKPRLIYTKKGASQASPSISPDGTRIAFVSNAGGSPRIYMMPIPPKGTSLKDISPKLISKSNTENTAPCFSPDGTKIAYSAKTKGYRQIWIYDLLTENEWQLTYTIVNKENPCFAPNSLHLVYNTSDRGSSELFLINLKQKKPIQISQGPFDKRFPSF